MLLDGTDIVIRVSFSHKSETQSEIPALQKHWKHLKCSVALPVTITSAEIGNCLRKFAQNTNPFTGHFWNDRLSYLAKESNISQRTFPSDSFLGNIQVPTLASPIQA